MAGDYSFNQQMSICNWGLRGFELDPVEFLGRAGQLAYVGDGGLFAFGGWGRTLRRLFHRLHDRLHLDGLFAHPVRCGHKKDRAHRVFLGAQEAKALA